ncbi:MAG: dihydroorotate dehydrogenase electron transfer subunit [Planctomycetales bacterium]|nr:dihydroorotate dehydrogenase electron transfer subunit [Planctomycetales bacterium]
MTHFADHARSFRAQLVANQLIAQDTRKLRITVPAMEAAPGQFFMVRNPATNDPLIGRALAMYDIRSDEQGSQSLELVYLVKGKLTTSLAKLPPGSEIAVWGPLGNGFTPTNSDHLIMVAGGVGQTPFLSLGKEALGQQHYGRRKSGYARRVSLCYGARTKGYLAGVEDFAQAGIDVHVATEDGSLGTQGRVTVVLEKLLQESVAAEAIQVVCCGPEPMMQAVAQIASYRNVPCQVSLETPMACGIGICFTCVARIGTAQDWDYKRTCVEGPVFDAGHVQWS